LKIQAILGDGQIKHIQQIIEEKGISRKICATNEHVPEIKRTMKERVRINAATLPSERYPPQLIVKMVYNCVFWLNSFPHKDGIHSTLITLMTGQRIL